MQLFRRANQSRILLESMNFIKGPFKASIKEDIKPFDLFTDNPRAFCVSLLHAGVLQDLVEWIFYNLTSGIRIQAKELIVVFVKNLRVNSQSALIQFRLPICWDHLHLS